MKKWLALLLVFVLLPLQSLAELAASYDEQGNFCSLYTSDSQTIYDVSPKTFPYSMPYADKEITIPSIAFYQAKIGHGYLPFVHIQIDASQLTEDELYWFREEDVRCFAQYAQSGGSSYLLMYTLLDLLWTDEKTIDFVLYSSTPVRNPFEETTVMASVSVTAPGGVRLAFDSRDVSVDTIAVHWDKDAIAAEDLLTIDPGLLEWIQKKLAEKDLSL